MAGSRIPSIVRLEARAPFSLALALASLVLAGLFVYVVLDLDTAPGGLTTIVQETMGQTGVDHPVTAVLLNLRAYDTWLELVVLLLGLLGVMAVRGSPSLSDAPVLARAHGLLGGLVQLLVPLMVVVGGYLLWLGKFDAGGAFQAGVVLGVALVLLWFAGRPSVERLPQVVLSAGLSAGILGFLAAAVVPMIFAEPMLQLPAEHAGLIIVTIETLATVSIGLAVACLLVGLQPVER